MVAGRCSPYGEALSSAVRGGVITALAHTDGEVVVILACDLPATDPHNVRLVVTAWRRRVLPSPSGERAVHRLLEQVETVAVAGLDPVAFVDVDAPEALRRARLVAHLQDRPDWRGMSDETPPRSTSAVVKGAEPN